MTEIAMSGCGEPGFCPQQTLPEPERERLAGLLSYERELWGQGFSLVAGLDEVGRGPIAGPVVAAAVIWPQGIEPEQLPAGLNDSKKLSEKKRYAMEPLIKQGAYAWAIGAVGARDIDRMNILQATKLAMLRAIGLLENMAALPQSLLLDALTLDIDLPQTGLIKGDAKSASIAAASILAKCHRDRMMCLYDQMYPGYGLAGHAGYPTPAHKQAVWALGPSPIHRRSFVLKPLKKRKQ